jgi:hypothetical protein
MTMATNHHYNMEAYQGQQIKMGNSLWINCLRTAQPIDIDKIKSVKWLGQYAAALVRPEVKKLWPLENEFFGPLLSDRKGWYYDGSKVDFAPAGTIQAEYDKEIFNSLAQFSSFSQTLLLYAREQFGL